MSGEQILQRSQNNRHRLKKFHLKYLPSVPFVLSAAGGEEEGGSSSSFPSLPEPKGRVRLSEFPTMVAPFACPCHAPSSSSSSSPSEQYFYLFPPSFLEPDRVINVRRAIHLGKKGRKNEDEHDEREKEEEKKEEKKENEIFLQYLVVWKGQCYSSATWERLEDVPEVAEEYKRRFTGRWRRVKEAERLQREVAKRMEKEREKEREKEMLKQRKRQQEKGVGKGGKGGGGKGGKGTGGGEAPIQALIPPNTVDVDIREDREIGRGGERMRGYQTEGVRWLFGHWSKAHNCIMGDVSGLGLFYCCWCGLFVGHSLIQLMTNPFDTNNQPQGKEFRECVFLNMCHAHKTSMDLF